MASPDPPMEAQEQIRRLASSARYRALAARRKRVVGWLTGLTLFQFAFYFLAIAYAPEWLGQLWPAGGAVSIVIWLTVLEVVLGVAIAGAYVWWAGRFYDPEKAALLRELADD